MALKDLKDEKGSRLSEANPIQRLLTYRGSIISHEPEEEGNGVNAVFVYPRSETTSPFKSNAKSITNKSVIFVA